MAYLRPRFERRISVALQLRHHLVAKPQRSGLVALVASVEDLAESAEVDLLAAIEGPELTPVPISGTHVLESGILPIDFEIDGAEEFVSRRVAGHWPPPCACSAAHCRRSSNARSLVAKKFGTRPVDAR